MRRLRGARIVISAMLGLTMLASVSALPDLRSLEIRHVPSQNTDLNFNKTLVDLKLSRSTIKPLTEALLTQKDRNKEVMSSNDLGNETNYNVNIRPGIDFLWKNNWEKRQVAPLRLCDSVKIFHFTNTKVEELPGCWVAACPRLEHLAVMFAKNLTELPANLLEGAIALKSLEFSAGALESLPEGFLLGATNLNRLTLNDNRLTMLTSANLMGPTGLLSLHLHDNQLKNEAMGAIASLSSLKILNIGNNQLSNLCERNGYSMLKKLTELRELYIHGLNITHLCRDWREMKFLKFIAFSKTQITELDFADVYLTKDSSVEEVTYMFDRVRLEKLRLTQDEYELGNRSPPQTNLSFISDNLLRTDCDISQTSKGRHENFSWMPNMPCLALEIVEN